MSFSRKIIDSIFHYNLAECFFRRRIKRYTIRHNQLKECFEILTILTIFCYQILNIFGHFRQVFKRQFNGINFANNIKQNNKRNIQYGLYSYPWRHLHILTVHLFQALYNHSSTFHPNVSVNNNQVLFRLLYQYILLGFVH